MRIKKLELIGFKSFKDRTVIQFDAGITGIVGPNGCGKSNIVDALLWVMGEMSVKELRGSQMQDVIFAGAEGFSPAGMAEVSLTLENDGGPFPLKYLKFSEIMVTRRLFRNGESEYFINREPARLRDIQEIFMDTGAGAKGFSIIQQGMIGRLIMAKPEEKRMLIEEAAGITKFKARKRESQRKLQVTDQNLVRLADVMSELKRQVEHLKKQVEKAERYRQIKKEIEGVDLKLASHDYGQLQKSKEEAQKKWQLLQERQQGLVTQVRSLEAELEGVKLEMARLQSEVDQKTQLVQEKQNLVQRLELEIQKLNHEIEQARTRGELTGSRRLQAQEREALLKKEYQEMKNQSEHLWSEIRRLQEEFQEQEACYLEQERQMEELDQELTVVRQELFALGQSESQIVGKNQVLQQQLQESERKFAESVRLLSEMQNALQQASEGWEQARRETQLIQNKRADFYNQKLNLQKLIDQKNDELRHLQAQGNGLKEEIGMLEARWKALQELELNFEGYSEGVKHVIRWRQSLATLHSQGGSDVPVTLYQVIEVTPGFERALESALGRRLQALVVDENQHIIEAARYLRSEKKGQASFINLKEWSVQASNLSMLPSEEPKGEDVYLLKDQVRIKGSVPPLVINHLLDRVAVTSTLIRALELKKQFPEWMFVSQEGDLVDRDGMVLVGEEAAQLLHRKREMQDLSLQIEESKGKLALVVEVIKKHEEEKIELERKVKEIDEQLVLLDQQITEFNKQVNRWEIELNHLNFSIDRLRLEQQKNAEQVAGLKQKIEEFESHRQGLLQRKEHLEEKKSLLSDQLVVLQRECSQMQERVTESKLQITEKTTLYQSFAQQCDRLKKDLDQVQEELSRMDRESQDASATLHRNQILLEERKVAFEREVNGLQKIRESVELVQEEFSQWQLKQQELSQALQSLQQDLNQCYQNVHAAQLEFEQIRLRENVLVDQVREKYFLLLPDIFEQYKEEELVRHLEEERLRELREKLQKMGEVNLAAIQEYEELQKRYQFLNDQYQDLLQAKDQLKRVIDRINHICTQRFKETFHQVNERFMRVFPALFGGGEAQLVLVEGEESQQDGPGIDIVAKPPGKKMQSLSLLSGGEKALTAVALIFAIFLVKPSPYCLLDEVDAPLDDANVTRFNDLIREMAKRSQIILVTHNKHTMEVAHRLYGVTMQTKGVSTMVSVNLEEVG
ncbi:MAG: chromosome segregation protein SMC [Bdellovibrionaceae bacterium]|nr:chromosome segregation protein SMC [Pseudobdellovibrionaceae bacterium]MDW8190974.1 chromosome segregation protein SMC [Pseudobdellovibrionaceae bacterium]